MTSVPPLPIHYSRKTSGGAAPSPAGALEPPLVANPRGALSTGLVGVL